MVYKLFIPPNELLSKNVREWNSAESKIYFNWFLSIREQRIIAFLDFLSFQLKGDTIRDINEIGNKLTRQLFNPIFSESKDGVLDLTNKGYALITDYAIFISETLIKNYPVLKWEIVRKPKKDISYNLPSIFGFSKIDHIDMIRGAIANGKAILRNEETGEIWLKMYNFGISVL